MAGRTALDVKLPARMPWRRWAGRLLEWYRGHARDLPWRRTTDPYAIWVSEIMLQQTQVKTVLPYWERWMRNLPEVGALAEAPVERLHKLWEGLGYYRRVRLMQAAARIILAEHKGKFPRSYEAVLALPGIGRYTAGAICSIAFNQPTPILDGNVIRVLTRLFAIPGNPRRGAVNELLWRLARGFVEGAAGRDGTGEGERNCAELNQALMEWGALVCLPQAPRCEVCPLRASCRARRTGRIAHHPALADRERPVARTFLAVVLEQRGQVVLWQRKPGEINAHLWEFPNVETTQEGREAETRFLAGLGLAMADLGERHTVRHSITRYRMTLEAVHVRRRRGPASLPAGWVWVPREKLGQLALTGAHGKVRRHFLGMDTRTGC